MSKPSVVKGGYFDVAVDPDGTGEFIYLCGLNTRNLTHQVNTTDEIVPTCQSPEEVPFRVLAATSQQKDMSGTGLHNRAQTALLRSILGRSLTYRFVEGEPSNDAVSQGYWQGPFVLTNWQEGAADKQNVTSQLTFASDGDVLWVDGTAPTLVALSLTPLTATATILWTGALTGVAQGSAIIVTSTGATGLVARQSPTTGAWSISGTWATTGSKTLTITETNPEAANSPLITSKTVVVS